MSGDPAKRTAADNQTVRNVFIIGPDKKIKLILVYPMTVGRNFDEVLRVIDSLQLGAKHKVATPVNWKQGEDVIIAGSVTDDDAKKLYPAGLEVAEAVYPDRAAAAVSTALHRRNASSPGLTRGSAFCAIDAAPAQPALTSVRMSDASPISASSTASSRRRTPAGRRFCCCTAPAATRTICCRWRSGSRPAARCSRRAARCYEHGMHAFLPPRAPTASGTSTIFKHRTAELADFLERARAPMGSAKPIALGYSNGANIAWSLLLKEPGALAGAILLRAMLPFDPRPLPDLSGMPVLLLAGTTTS